VTTVDHDPLSLLSPAVTAALTGDEYPRILRAMSFLASNAQNAGVPHAEWWQLHYRHEAAFPWRVIDLAAPEGPTGTGHTVIVFLRLDGLHLTAETTDAGRRHRTLHNLRLELEDRGCTLRGVWELRERGYAADLMASSRLPHPRDRHTRAAR